MSPCQADKFIMSYQNDKNLIAIFLCLISFMSTISLAKPILVDDKKVSTGYSDLEIKKRPDQYQCSQNKASGVVGILTENSQYLIQAVASFDRDGVREVSGVISDQSALADAANKSFMDAYSMPPINGEGGYGSAPQGSVWNSVAELSVAAHTDMQNKNSGMGYGGGFYGSGMGYGGGIGYGMHGGPIGAGGMTGGIDFNGNSAETVNTCDKPCMAALMLSFANIYYGQKESKEFEKENLQNKESNESTQSNTPQKTGDLAGKKAGDLAGKVKTAGRIAGNSDKAGDLADISLKAGDIAAMHMKQGDQVYWASRVQKTTPRAGENIGKKGITTFTALIDKDGNLKKVVYKSGTDFQKTISADDKNHDRNDPVVSQIKTNLDKFTRYASCCKSDSKSECDTRHRPEITVSKPINNKTTPPPVDEPSGSGGPGFNPFTGTTRSKK